MSISDPQTQSPISKQTLSTWSAIAIAGFTAFSAYMGQKDTQHFAMSFEGGHYEAIVDLRSKVDFLFTKVVACEEAVRPPGPAQESPPDPDAGSTSTVDASTSPDAKSDPVKPVPEETSLIPVQQVVPFDLDDLGRPKWKPVKRK